MVRTGFITNDVRSRKSFKFKAREFFFMRRTLSTSKGKKIIATQSACGGFTGPYVLVLLDITL